MKMRIPTKSIAAVAAAGLFAAASPGLTTGAHAQPYNLTVAGYSPGGLVSTVGAGLDAALAAAYPGSTVTYQTSSGGLANSMLVTQKKVPLGFVSDTELAVAVNGRPPINTKLSALKMLLSPYTAESRFQATHVLANKDWAEKHGIETLADIGNKKPPMKVAVNRPGNLDGDVGLATLATAGLTPEAIESAGGQVVRAASREMTSLMLDRRIDVVVFGISYNHPRIREMANGLELRMLPMTQAAADKVAADLGATPCAFAASEYAFLDKDSASVCVGMAMVAHEDMDDETAYNVVKGIVENVDKFRNAHRLLKKVVTKESLAKPGQAPFHPGAEKYLKEAGLLN